MVGTKLQVLHRTVYEYASPIVDSVNTLHLEPRTFPFQRTLSAIIRVIPAIRLRRFTDLYQNITHHFEILGPHLRLEVESRLKIHNLPLVLPERSLIATREELDDSSTRERAWPFLQESRYVSRHPSLWRQALDVTQGRLALHDQALGIMDWIHREFSYQPGSTEVNTHVDEAFERRTGVCQDFTHVMIGMCRAIGLPARYASGYLYNGPSDCLIGAQGSHAWCEVYLPHVGWIGYDPTNNTLADERYVKAAVGRDYEDVAPLKGSYVGTAHAKLSVDVIVEKIV